MTAVREAWGDVDLAALGALLADPSRCRILLALGDGRALPASRLAAEAGVTAATASSHLAKLVGGDLLVVETHGRHRFYRLAGPRVARLIEVLAQSAPAQPVRSLRQGTRAHALREARSCYDHLAGRLGVEIMSAMISRGHLSGGDGTFDPDRAGSDRLNAYGSDVEYRLSSSGSDLVASLGIGYDAGRAPIRYCVDWSEQRHHLSGPLGHALLDRFVELGWVRRSAGSRAVQVAADGRDNLAARLGIEWEASVGSSTIRSVQSVSGSSE
jgi:DNA-binding transcriptional ArsR family regulator